ncbi:CBS domain-containing protein [Nonomuraea sp. NPDC050547]|uniref:CBS domain-containing protein n=1 Tax=Nonomuraea sp. NPDC050547 TaxID=3364368 RepID=UPI003798EC5B
MTTARDIMTPHAECVNADESLVQAAQKMARLEVGSLPICGPDHRLKGILTDRDIVIKALAQGKDPSSCTASELAQGKPVTIGADDDDTHEILRTMAEHKVRACPSSTDTTWSASSPWPTSPRPCPTPPSATCSTP